ncbi:hypothetical protein D3C87_1857930 [compost metagenome]
MEPSTFFANAFLQDLLNGEAEASLIESYRMWLTILHEGQMAVSRLFFENPYIKQDLSIEGVQSVELTFTHC